MDIRGIPDRTGLAFCHPERRARECARESKLSRIAGVQARRRNPERSRGSSEGARCSVFCHNCISGVLPGMFRAELPDMTLLQPAAPGVLRLLLTRFASSESLRMTRVKNSSELARRRPVAPNLRFVMTSRGLRFYLWRRRPRILRRWRLEIARTRRRLLFSDRVANAAYGVDQLRSKPLID